MKHTVRFSVNGQEHEITVPSNQLLLDALRDRLGLTGTKRGCDEGVCGACTVLMDGEPVNSCLTLAVEADGHSITTIEGLARDGQFHPLQEAFIQHGAVQCGYCTAGMLLTSKALLDRNSNPSEEDVRSALNGNLCRCTGYVKIVEAIRSVARSETGSPLFPAGGTL